MRRKPRQRKQSAIHAAAEQHPYLALIAAVIQQAVVDARLGSYEARAWLTGKVCRRWLEFLVPDPGDPEAVQQQLVQLSFQPLTDEELEAA